MTNKEEALFFILRYYKSYLTLQNLGMYFGISDAATSAYLELLKLCLKAALHQQGTENRVLAPSQETFDK